MHHSNEKMIYFRAIARYETLVRSLDLEDDLSELISVCVEAETLVGSKFQSFIIHLPRHIAHGRCEH